MRDDDSTARTIHRAFQRYTWRHQGSVGHVLVCAAFVAGIPVVLAIIAGCTAIHGARVWRREGKGPLRQAGEQLRL